MNYIEQIYIKKHTYLVNGGSKLIKYNQKLNQSSREGSRRRIK